mgnify:CR=1 FL=1
MALGPRLDLRQSQSLVMTPQLQQAIKLLALSNLEVEAVIAEARDVAGITPIAFDAATIQRQLLAAIVNEAACLLAEGVAQCPSDVDVVLTSGYGFPRWRGGPLYWAAQQDRAMIRADLTDLADAVGHGFQAGPVDDTLDQIKTGQET